MSPKTRALLLRAALCAGLLPLPAVADAAPPALSGDAWTQADLAERSYANSRFGDALNEVNAALKLRPDVPELHLRKVYTLQKLGRPGDARKAAQAALASGINDPALHAEASPPGSRRTPRKRGTDALPESLPAGQTGV